MDRIILILNNLRSVYNTASLFRSADCFGISKIYLCGTTPTPIDRFGRDRGDFAKVSLGAEKTVAYEYSKDTVDTVKILQSEGYMVAALEQSEKSVLLHNINLEDNSKIAIVLGNEVEGVSSDVLGAVDQIWEIEQFGEKESLNVCIAGAIAMYQVSVNKK